ASAMSFSLTATATERDAAGNTSTASASEAVTVASSGGGTSSGAWPDATNTGVPAGTVLTSASSNTISQPGVYNALSFHGPVYITASNVILQNCQITGGNSDLFE